MGHTFTLYLEQPFQYSSPKSSSEDPEKGTSNTGANKRALTAMTIPTDPTAGVKLYAHEPRSLIPLLQHHQPRSLPVLSSIYENLLIPKQTSNATGCDVVWATFPPNHLLSNDEGIWGVVVKMPEDRIHLRFYCSAESKSTGNDEDDIQEFIRGVTGCIVDIYGIEIMLGAIDSRWNSVMRDVVDARDLVECAVFLAPISLTAGAGTEQGEGVRDGNGTGDEEVLAGMGLIVDRARDEDMSIVCHYLSLHSSMDSSVYDRIRLCARVHLSNILHSTANRLE